MIDALARLFQGIHIAFGITGLEANAPYERKRKFVFMWCGILLLLIGWCALIPYLLGIY